MTRRLIRRLAIAQVIAWLSFAASIVSVGIPLWIPTPVTLGTLTLIGR